MADLAISVATPFIEYLIAPIGRQCGYIVFYRRYLRELEHGVDKLKDELEGIQHQCEAATRNAMNIEPRVTSWIQGVNGAVHEANALLFQANTAGGVIPQNDFQSWFKRCVCLSQQADQASDAIPSQNVDLAVRKKFYLNPVVRYKKGHKAKKTMLVIQGLNEDKKNLGEISYEASTTPILSLKDYQSFRSREEIVDSIMRTLSDTEAPAIGVWGMGGVGKSMLMKEIMRLARDSNLFADVAMADVSQNPDVKKIQEELADWLGLKFKDDENVRVRAARLHKRLKPTDKMKGTAESLKKQNAIRPEENQDGRAFEPFVEGRPEVKQKQVLIILDNIWRGLDLEEIGIPLDGGAVKLLFTSRKQHVLSSEMNCSQNVFELEVLNGGEPLRLFESIVGEIVTSDSRFRTIGEEVVQKCSGLPIVIKAIATTLRNRSLQEWEDALIQFKGSKDAYSNLEISYKHLESEELKSLFLVCALTNSASIGVQDLLYYCMGLGLLITGTNTVRSARKKLKALLHDLQDSSLLLKDDDQDPDYVRIHDVVREVAIRIASRDHNSVLMTDEFELKEIPRKKIKSSKAISIPYVNFRKLPEGWECPELKMFLLYRRVDDPPIDISDSFFEGMKELCVLDFTGRRCDSLPSSIQFLLNLNTLCLDSCSIEDLAIIGKLKKLQILTFIGSEIARLPKEIGELSELKVLNLTNSKLEVIEPGVLGRLTSLEELHLKGSSFIRWEDERETQPKNAKLSELNNLSNLSIVNIHIQNPSTIPNHLEFGNLAEYIIQIGDVWDWNGDYKESRMLKIKLELCHNNFLHEKWVQDLLKRTQYLHLDGIKGWLIRSFHELCLDGFQELKHLHLQNSSLVQCVAHSVSKWSPCTTFTVLESLFLEKLSGLEMISRGPIASIPFSKLKVIKVIDCGKLISLFSYSMLKGLSKLEEIEVGDCDAMQVIVTVDSVATNTEAVKLQALHRIKLHNLPNFMRFCSRHRAEINQAEVKPRSSEIVQEDPHIPTSCAMFSDDQLVSLPLLKSLILSNLPKLKHIWQYNYCPIEVANLECLEVSSCDDLLIVIPSRLVKEVTKLETLMVKDCGSLQEVFETSDGDALNLTSDDMEILSRLNQLELSNLPFLRHIWENNHQLEKVRAFQNLNLLMVVNCSSLMNLLPAALMKSLNQLREIYVKSCKEMKEVVPPENDGRSGETKNIVFESLADVWLEDLPNMVTFVWTKGGEAINFPSIKELYVVECPKMRSFSLLKENESAPELCFFDDKVRLPKLARLDLISLRSLQKIWREEILEESFCSLEILAVRDCEALVDVIPSINMTAAGIGRLQFHNLKAVVIRECSSLRQPIFKFAEGKGHYYCLSQLEKLYLFDLPKLEHVVQPDSHVVVGFPNLVEIEVEVCECVIELFPIATVTTLSKLQDLKIFRCSSMRQIFGKHEEEEDDEMLDSGASCMLGFPSLESLEILRCSNLTSFVQGHTSDQKLDPSSPFTKEEGVHYLFDDKVLVPKLVKLVLISVGSIEKIWHEEILEETFFQLESLVVRDCQSLVKVFPSKYVTRTHRLLFQNLKTVVIRECSSLEGSLFESVWEEGDEKLGKQVFSLPQLEKLWLIKLSKLEHVIHPTSNVVLKFQSLVEISIGDCQCLIDLFPSATAATLSKLEKVKILRCSCMRYVFGKEEDAEEEEDGMLNLISFPCLRTIVVQGLYSMICFFLGTDCQIDFPSLEDLEISWCHVLKTFVQRHKSEDVHYLFDHKVDFPNIQKMKLNQLSSLQTLWKNELLPSNESCTRLKSLDVWDCKNLRHIFPRNKKPLERLTAEDGELVICFRELDHLDLSNLQNLRSFSSANCTLEFPSLEQVTVMNCPYLDVFSSSTVLAPKLSNVLFGEEAGSLRWDGDLNTTIQNYQNRELFWRSR